MIEREGGGTPTSLLTRNGIDDSAYGATYRATDRHG